MARTKKKNIEKESIYNDLTHNHLPPALDYKFIRKLENIHRINATTPALRVVWGCTEKWFRLDRMRLKYLTGYALEQTVTRTKSGLLVEEDYAVELGLPRHIIEVWLPPSYFGGIIGQSAGDFYDPDAKDYKEKLAIWEAVWNAKRFEFVGVESVTKKGAARLNAMNNEVHDLDFASTLGKVGAKLVDVLGPFPRNGEYRYFATIEDEDTGEYRYPTMKDIDWLAEAYRVGYLEPQPEQPSVCAVKEQQDEKVENYIRSLFNKSDLHKEATNALAASRRVIFDLGK